MSEPVVAIEISGQVISFAQESLVLAAITALLGAMLGWLITYMLQQKHMTRMQTRLRMEQYATQRALEDMEQRFANLSTEALQKNHQAFINLAMENLGKFQRGAEASLQQREQSVENIVKPIRDALDKT